MSGNYDTPSPDATVKSRGTRSMQSLKAADLKIRATRCGFFGIQYVLGIPAKSPSRVAATAV
jgi:hypothetical protein